MDVLRSWRSFFVFLLWVFFFVIKLAKGDTICDLKGCNCTVKVATWKTVNCSLSGVQDLRLDLYRVPQETVDVFITGGERILLGPKSFDRMPGLAILHIEGTRTVVMEKQSFRNVTTPSLIIQIQNCDHLSIKTGAFDNVQSSIEVEIIRCGSVNVEKTAFGKLKSALFREIPKLILETQTFEFKNQGSIGRHGPVTIISFDTVKITTIPPQTFFSSLADVTFRNSYIGEIKNEAFSANQISSITIYNSTVDYINSNSFINRTQIFNFKLQKCLIKQIQEGAVMSAITNLTVQHSNITDIKSGAINCITVAKVDISDNQIDKLHSSSFIFNNWNKILFNNNIIQYLDSNSILAPINSDIIEFSFNGNEIFNFKPGALSFVPDLEDRIFIFKDNFFEQTCHCTLDEWIVELITANITNKIKKIANNTFCRVNDLLSQCFELKIGVINVQNFTQLVCNTNNTIVCEPYQGETKIVNTTHKIFTDENFHSKTNWLTVIISTTSILIIIVIITSVLMLIRGSRWLKRKGYFRKIQYNQNEHSNDEENTIETVDEGDKLDISEDLTMELLQDLSKKLDDPLTHQEASEMIEQLYQKYIHNVGSENNNQQDDEAHLYEELGNLQANEANKQQNGPRSILRLMEERFNTQFEDIDADDRPALVGEYSEPSDAAVHLYSELKQNKDESENKDSLKSRGSSNMAFRPLPDKPGSSKM